MLNTKCKAIFESVVIFVRGQGEFYNIERKGETNSLRLLKTVFHLFLGRINLGAQYYNNAKINLMI